MSDVEALQKFAEFQATKPWQIGSATDIIDITETYTEASTEPYILEQLLLLTFSKMVSYENSPLPGSSYVDAPESAPDQAPVSDFDMLDDLRTPKGQLRRQIRALRRSSRLPYRERLARRLDDLLDVFEEEGERWAEESPDSLREMLSFLQAVPDFRCPTVTVTPSATFRVQWQAGKNEHFAADFLPDGQVRFVVFAPDPRHADRVQRVSGVVSRADLMRAVEPYKVHRWAADAGA